MWIQLHCCKWCTSNKGAQAREAGGLASRATEHLREREEELRAEMDRAAEAHAAALAMAQEEARLVRAGPRQNPCEERDRRGTAAPLTIETPCCTSAAAEEPFRSRLQLHWVAEAKSRLGMKPPLPGTPKSDTIRLMYVCTYEMCNIHMYRICLGSV